MHISREFNFILFLVYLLSSFEHSDPTPPDALRARLKDACAEEKDGATDPLKIGYTHSTVTWGTDVKLREVNYYDGNDRMIFSQDGNQRAQGTPKWTYYLYDTFGRLAQQGECTGKNASSNTVVHVQNYYDGYGFVGGTGFPTGQFPPLTRRATARVR